MKSDVDRLYVKRKEGGSGLISVERCIREEENSLGFYVANSEENLIRGVLTAEKINTRETITSVEFNSQKEYKRGHDNVAKKVHWDICKKNGLEQSEK